MLSVDVDRDALDTFGPSVDNGLFLALSAMKMAAYCTQQTRDRDPPTHPNAYL